MTHASATLDGKLAHSPKLARVNAALRVGKRYRRDELDIRPTALWSLFARGTALAIG